MSQAGRRGKPTAVGRVSISSVVRMPQGKRLWLGPFRREANEQGRNAVSNGSAKVRLFVIQSGPWVARRPYRQALVRRR